MDRGKGRKATACRNRRWRLEAISRRALRTSPPGYRVLHQHQLCARGTSFLPVISLLFQSTFRLSPIFPSIAVGWCLALSRHRIVLGKCMVAGTSSGTGSGKLVQTHGHRAWFCSTPGRTKGNKLRPTSVAHLLFGDTHVHFHMSICAEPAYRPASFRRSKSCSPGVAAPLRSLLISACSYCTPVPIILRSAWLTFPL